jgi:prevent-host-death family protein
MAQRESRISATDARVHFGEVMQRVENGEAIIVERSGEETAAIISIEEYREYRQWKPKSSEMPDWFERARESREQIAQSLDGKSLPWDEIFDQMREERDAELLENLYRR